MRSARELDVHRHVFNTLGILLAALLIAPGCGKNEESKEGEETEAPGAEDSEATAAKTVEKEEPESSDRMNRGKGEHRGKKGKWRKAGVYVDGEPIAFLRFAELPLSLEPVWVEGEMDLEFRAGDPGPRTKKVKYRRYRLAEYLEALGVNLKKVKELHIYGGYFAGRLTGRDLRRARDDFYFGFGRVTHGKALLYPSEKVSIGTSFDSIAAIAVYIDKKPPKVLESAEVEFEGKVTNDIPYYGKPLRGGVRVYKDDRMVTVIKRRKLKNEDELAEWKGEELRWQLGPFLKAQGVDVTDVVAAEVIFNERRTSRLSGDEVRKTFFLATPQQRGEISLGEDKEPVEVLALYTKKLPPRDEEKVVYQVD